MQAASKHVPLMKGSCLVTVRADGCLFGIAEIARGEAFKLFTEL